MCWNLELLPVRRMKQFSLILVIVSLTLMVRIFRLEGIVQLWHHNDKDICVPKLSAQPTESLPGTQVLPGQPASLVKVNGSRTLLISAYLEHRTKKKEVRVIAIVLRSEKIKLYCYLRCQEKLLISKSDTNIHTDHFGFPYGTADIMCSLPPGCETPTHVAVTTNATTHEDKLDGFLVINNQKEVTDSFPYNFTVCFSAMYNFTNVLQLVQNLEMLRFLGVNRVVVYRTNCSVDTQRILDRYTRKGFLEVIPWSLSTYLNVSRKSYPKKSPADLHYFGQIPALKDCLYRNMYRSRYVALHDPDELILPQSLNSWLELLPLLEKKLGADKCYMFENNWFPVEFTLPPPEPLALPRQDQWGNISGTNFLTHLYREPKPTRPTFNNFKIIVNPRAIFSATVHGVLDSNKGCVWVDPDVARMYHVKSRGEPKQRPDQMIYDSRLLSYSTYLISAVDTELRQSGLLPGTITN